MYDARTLTRKQMFELAGVVTNDGFMTTRQLRRLTGMSHTDLYAAIRRLRIGWKKESCGRLCLVDDVLARARDGSLPVHNAPMPSAARLSKVIGPTRVTEEEASVFLSLCQYHKMSQSEVIRHLILTAHKNLT